MFKRLKDALFPVPPTSTASAIPCVQDLRREDLDHPNLKDARAWLDFEIPVSEMLVRCGLDASWELVHIGAGGDFYGQQPTSDTPSVYIRWQRSLPGLNSVLATLSGKAT